MITIKTYLSNSSISGIGVFAAEDISKGTITWRYSEFFDLTIPPEKIQGLSIEEKKLFEDLRYYWIDRSGNYVMPLDHDRFINHSFDPNIISKDAYTEIAARDIKAHEELTSDYRAILPEEMWDDYCKNESKK